jgi:hypothetical protein
MPEIPPHYLVTLDIRSGEYEKLSRKLICADDEIAAGRAAIESEMHHDVGEGAEWEDDCNLTDAHGEFHYRVKSVVPVLAPHVWVLQTYMR